MTESKAAGFLEHVRKYVDDLIVKHSEMRFDSHYIELKRFIEELEKSDKDSMSVIRMLEKNNIKTGPIVECSNEKKESVVFTIPGARKYCQPNTQREINTVFDLANQYTSDDGKKTVCIKIMMRGDSPFVMSFEYTGDAQEDLKHALIKIYPNATLSVTNEHIIISEVVDDYADYMRKYSTLTKNNKLTPFIRDMHILTLDFPEGVEHGVSFIRIDTSVGPQMFQPIINITDNRHYDHCTINNSGGGSITINEISNTSGINIQNINMNYVKWLSNNNPHLGEKRSAYYARMKSDNSDFVKSKQFHNKIMRSLGWKDVQDTKGNHIWQAY